PVGFTKLKNLTRRGRETGICGASLLLAALGHAGAVHLNLKVTPQVLWVFRGRAVALADGRSSPGACAITVGLSQGGCGGCNAQEPYGQHCDTIEACHCKLSWLDGGSFTTRRATPLRLAIGAARLEQIAVECSQTASRAPPP